MSQKTLTLSIVIPVCNEERYIGACLDSIAAQTQKPDEVIVVDNNSSDTTVQIVRKYRFVTILHEIRQHQSFAQKKGFDAAKGDILGRIDADTMLPKDWVVKVKEAFADEPGVVAITGGALPYDVKMHRFGRAVFRFYSWLASGLGGARLLWGANSAIRAGAWHKVTGKVLLRDDIWEDQDLSFCLRPLGKIKLLDNIDVGTSFRALHHPFFHQARYQFRSVRTFYLHKGLFSAITYGLLWSTMIPIYLMVLFDSFVLKPLSGFKEPY